MMKRLAALLLGLGFVFASYAEAQAFFFHGCCRPRCCRPVCCRPVCCRPRCCGPAYYYTQVQYVAPAAPPVYSGCCAVVQATCCRPQPTCCGPVYYAPANGQAEPRKNAPPQPYEKTPPKK